MSSYGFPTLLQYSRLSAAVADIKSRTEQARTELVTGRIADLKTELGSTVGDAQLLSKAIDDVGALQRSTQRALGRAGAAQIAIARAVEDVETIGANLLSAVGQNDTQSINVAANQGRLQLEAAMSAFNSRYEGRSLFSGDASTQPALASAETLLTDIRAIFAGAADMAQLQTDLDTYFNDPAGGFATNIYTGGAGDAARAEITNGELVNYSARADEQPVRDLLRGLSTLVIANEQTTWPDRSQALTAAGAGMLQATNDVVAVRSRVGAAEERMAATEARLSAEATALGVAYNERASRDPYEAASLLQALEAQLEASYVVTSRISQLSLTNYFR